MKNEKSVDELIMRIKSDTVDFAMKQFKAGYDEAMKVKDTSTESAYEQGLKDAWECARKLRHPSYGGFYDNEQKEIFGYESSDEVLTRFTAAEALLRIEEWKNEKRKRPEWIVDTITYCGVDLANYKCSKCGEIGGSWRKGLKPDKLPKFCSNCGARMYGG